MLCYCLWLLMKPILGNVTKICRRGDWMLCPKNIQDWQNPNTPTTQKRKTADREGKKNRKNIDFYTKQNYTWSLWHTCWPRLRSATTAQQSCRILQWLGLYLPLQYFCMIQLLEETQALTRIQRMEQNPIEKEPRGWPQSLHWHQSLFEWGQQLLWSSVSCRCR